MCPSAREGQRHDLLVVRRFMVGDGMLGLRHFARLAPDRAGARKDPGVYSASGRVDRRTVMLARECLCLFSMALAAAACSAPPRSLSSAQDDDDVLGADSDADDGDDESDADGSPKLDVGAGENGDGDPDPDGEADSNMIDILFVIDNSGSTAQEQLNLARNFPLLVQQLDGLTDSEGNPVAVDVQVMVTTTDMRHSACVTSSGAAYGRPQRTACTSRLGDFWFQLMKL